MNKKGSLTYIATRGFFWNALSIILTRGFGFVSQLALGWLLAKDDFAVYALAIASSTLVMALKNGGTELVLIQKSNKFNDYAPSAITIAVIFNIIAALILLVAAPSIASIYQKTELVSLANVIAVSLVIGTPTVIFRSDLCAKLRFGEIAKIDTISAFIRHGSMIAFAMAGMGPISFVLPLILVAIYEVIAFGIESRYWPVNIKLVNLSEQLKILKESRWIMLGAIGVSLANHGDYLVVGYLMTETQLATYFFGFQMVVAAMALFDGSTRAVMLPSLALLTDQRERQGVAFLKSARVILVTSAIFSVVIFLVSPVAIDLLWDGKWNESIIVVQVLVLTIPLWSILSLEKSLLEARGMWKKRTVFIYFEALSLLVAATLGSLEGGLTTLIIFVALHRVLVTTILSIYVVRIFGMNFFKVLSIKVAFLLPIYTSGMIVYFLFTSIITINNSMVSGVFMITSFGIFIALMWRGFVGENIREVYHLLENGIRKAES